ncbi:unnamed protein product [Danaus chrysippus]|nr:unnamed protein product [Danaus chrysippus]
MKYEGTINCRCSGKEKKIKLPELCPCEKYRPRADEFDAFDTDTAFQEKDRKKKKKSMKGKKNFICECPEEPEPEPEPIFVPYIDERILKKMKSDLTQSTSGFTFNINRKNMETEMSFEDALKFFEDHPEFNPPERYNEELCACRNKLLGINRPGSAPCICPEEIPPYVEPEEEPFQGFKFQIGAKGSGSKGLSGILCFDVVEN